MRGEEFDDVTDSDDSISVTSKVDIKDQVIAEIQTPESEKEEKEEADALLRRIATKMSGGSTRVGTRDLTLDTQNRSPQITVDQVEDSIRKSFKEDQSNSSFEFSENND